MSSKLPSNISKTETQVAHVTLPGRTGTQGEGSLIGQGDSVDLTLRSGDRGNYSGL